MLPKDVFFDPEHANGKLSGSIISIDESPLLVDGVSEDMILRGKVYLGGGKRNSVEIDISSDRLDFTPLTKKLRGANLNLDKKVRGFFIKRLPVRHYKQGLNSRNCILSCITSQDKRNHFGSYNFSVLGDMIANNLKNPPDFQQLMAEPHSSFFYSCTGFKKVTDDWYYISYLNTDVGFFNMKTKVLKPLDNSPNEKVKVLLEEELGSFDVDSTLFQGAK